MSMPPVVYVGPSLEPHAVKEWLPQAQVMPPIRRGDLYRDRLLGFRLFLIVDGVFFHDLAISPREVVDVVRDHGIVVGASSMGAMRAAECWPAGVHGVGSIYRMFRRAHLTSDDEVAVAFSPTPPYRAATVPLVNIRYALSRAVRAEILTRVDANRIVRFASQIHYAERTWDSILQSANVVAPDNTLSTSLRRYDLKRMDALRALRRLRKWITESPHLLDDDGRKRGQCFLAVGAREARHDAPAHGQAQTSKQDLWRWLVATGRYRRYAIAALGSFVDTEVHWAPRSALNPNLPEDVHGKFTAHVNGQWISRLGISADDLASAVARRHALVQLVGKLANHDTEIARAVWAEVVVCGDLDALVFRFTAMRKAVDWARACSLRPHPGHWYLAMRRIAYFHGFPTWSELRAALGTTREVWPWIEQSAEETALAKRVRHALFSGTGATPNLLGFRSDSHGGYLP